jgi:YidC/Oxa1 family membrane protein insertase
MDRNAIFAIVLIGLVIILMPMYYRWMMPEKPVQEPPPVTQTPVTEAPSEEPSTTVQEPSTERGVTAAAIREVPPDSADFPTEGTEEFVQVETDLMTLTFSTKGARVVSCRLLEYPSFMDGVVEIIREERNANLVASFGFPGRFVQTEDIYFTPSVERLSLKAGESGSVTFRTESGDGRIVEERFTFYGDNYHFDWAIDAYGVGGGMPGEEVWLSWNGGLSITEPDTLLSVQYSKAYAFYGDDLIKYDVGKKDTLKTGDTKWVAMRNRYFEAAMIPQGEPAGAFFVKGERLVDVAPNEKSKQPKVFQATLIDPMHGADYHREMVVFLGPMDYSILKAQGIGLQKTMDWGWDFFRLTVPILWIMKTLHSVIPNYGLVLILFSVLVKVIVWPLTHKSHESMKRMQVLQPMIKEMREKYKNDMQRVQKETMKLYKEHKVNPMGGCLPLLIQMPLFIALFSVFRSTIELRGAPFLLWITDLSSPDYIFHLPFSIPMYGAGVAILPIVMGLSTYFQSKLTMTDPNQKMMLYIMPVFLVLIFNKMPAGLTLYYTLFNILTLLQQRIVKTHDVTLEPAEKPAEVKGKPKG